jgi:serine/threonine-protein kinase HipA
MSFRYGLRYLDRPSAFEVDPRALSLRGRQSVRGVALFPLPGLSEFGGLRDAAPDAWGRRVIEAKLRVPANSLDELTYLLEAGSDRVGALDVRESLEADPKQPAGALTSLPYLLQAAEAIEAGEEIPAGLIPYLGGAPSAGGARPKASVRDEQGILWLAKFPAKGDRYDMAIVEAATLELARRAGMTVPPLRLHQVLGQSLLLIRRFDRYWAEPGQILPAAAWAHETEVMPGLVEGRMPQVSGLTLVGCDEMDSITKEYKHLAAAIRECCHPRFVARDTAELFARMVFNIFVTNDDDHLRNHAFLYDAALGGWRLSPLYDVVPRPMVAHERLLHLGVGQQGRLATLDNAMSEHAAFIPDRPAAMAVLRRVWGAVRQWKLCFEEMGAGTALVNTMASAIRPLEDIASSALALAVRRGV